MNREEAKQALEDGLVLTHSSFMDHEWVRKAKYRVGRYEFENSCVCKRDEFWQYRKTDAFNTDWEVVNTEA